MTRHSAGELAALTQGRLVGDAGITVGSAAGLSEATVNDVSFFHNPKYLNQLAETKAGIVLVPRSTDGAVYPAQAARIHVENPQWAFGQVLALFEKAQRQHPAGVHPRAIVEPTADIAPDVIIYPGAYIGHRVQIGEGSLVYANAVLREDTMVGKRVIIHAGAVLGADGYGFATVDGRHHKIPQIGRVVIEDDVEIGANVTIDRATTGETRIGAGTKIDNLVHIAHNCQIGRNCLIVAQVGISGSTRIGSNVTLAGQVGVTGHLTIGDNAVIAAQSGIMNDVAPGDVLFGSPGRPIKLAMKLQAIYGKLPELYEAFKSLKKKETVS